MIDSPRGAVDSLISVPDLNEGDVVVTETGAYRVLSKQRYPDATSYTGGAGSPAGIPCWHISVATLFGSPRGGLVRTDWDYFQRFASAQPEQEGRTT